MRSSILTQTFLEDIIFNLDKELELLILDLNKDTGSQAFKNARLEVLSKDLEEAEDLLRVVKAFNVNAKYLATNNNKAVGGK